MRTFLLVVIGLLICSSGVQSAFLLEDVVDVTIYGASEENFLGLSLDGIGDVNQDGFDDLVADIRVNEGGIEEEKVYLIYGSNSLPTIIDLATPPKGRILEVKGADRIGGTGDFNRDGYDDFAIAEVGRDVNEAYDAGAVMIINGTSNLPDQIDFQFDNLEGTLIHGYRIGEWVGTDIHTAGDINNDGFYDVLLGGNQDIGNNLWEVIIIYGGTDLPSVLSTEDLGGHGVIITSAFSLDQFGDSFDAAGDVNSDGFDDVIIGANAVYGENLPERAYLVYGGTDIPPLMQADNLENHGIIIEAGREHNFPADVKGAGDVNRDGYDDILVSWTGASPNGIEYAGEVYIVFGGRNLPSVINIMSFGNRGITIQGTEEDQLLGLLMASGNFNGDSYPDLVIKPTTYLTDFYLLFGGPEYGQARKVTLDNLDPITIHNPYGDLGYPDALEFIGDINGDGYEDLAIGDQLGSIRNEGGGIERFECGIIHIIFGGPDKFGLATPTPTITPTETLPIEPTRTPTPTLTPQKTQGFSGWILSGEGGVKVVSEPTPKKVK